MVWHIKLPCLQELDSVKQVSASKEKTQRITNKIAFIFVMKLKLI